MINTVGASWSKTER